MTDIIYYPCQAKSLIVPNCSLTKTDSCVISVSVAYTACKFSIALNFFCNSSATYLQIAEAASGCFSAFVQTGTCLGFAMNAEAYKKTKSMGFVNHLPNDQISPVNGNLSLTLSVINNTNWINS